MPEESELIDVAKTFPTLHIDLKYATGTVPHEAMMRSIELYGTEVIPRVRALLAAE